MLELKAEQIAALSKMHDEALGLATAIGEVLAYLASGGDEQVVPRQHAEESLAGIAVFLDHINAQMKVARNSTSIAPARRRRGVGRGPNGAPQR